MKSILLIYFVSQEQFIIIIKYICSIKTQIFIVKRIPLARLLESAFVLSHFFSVKR